MELSHVTYVLLVALAMTFTISSALPYPSWYDPESTALDGDERYPTDLGNDLDRIRQFIALKLMSQGLAAPSVLDNANDDNKRNSRAKRLDFGFAGLDNMDHILSTLDRKEAMRSLPGSRFLKNMKSQGYRGVNNMAKLTKLMENVG